MLNCKVDAVRFGPYEMMLEGEGGTFKYLSRLRSVERRIWKESIIANSAHIIHFHALEWGRYENITSHVECPSFLFLLLLLIGR